MENRYEDHLSHHGILGQKWGQRNGPPYPLGVSDHSSSERKAGWKKSLSKNKDSDADSTKINGYLDVVFLNTAVNLIEFNLIMKGLNAVHNILKRHKERKDDRNVTGEVDLPRKKSKGTIESDRAATNPKFTTEEGYMQNCMYCSVAYDLRRRGYDVTANKRKEGGYPREFKELYKNPEMKTYSKVSKAKAFAELQNQPEGARGIICGTSRRYGGHAIAYEIRNGKVELVDGQADKSWSWDFFSKHYSSYTITRTDNVEPNWDKIGEAIDPDSLKKKEDSK